MVPARVSQKPSTEKGFRLAFLILTWCHLSRRRRWTVCVAGPSISLRASSIRKRTRRTRSGCRSGAGSARRNAARRVSSARSGSSACKMHLLAFPSLCPVNPSCGYLRELSIWSLLLDRLRCKDQLDRAVPHSPVTGAVSVPSRVNRVSEHVST